LRRVLARIWSHPSEEGLAGALARRTVLMMWVGALSAYFLAIPFIMAEHARHQLNSLALQGEMLGALEVDKALLSGQTLAHDFAVEYGIEALYIPASTETPLASGRYIILGEASVLGKADTIFDLRNATWYSRVAPTMAIILPIGDDYIRVNGLQQLDHPQIDVFIAKAFLRDRLWDMFLSATAIGLVIFLVAHFLVRRMAARLVHQTLSNVLARIYGRHQDSDPTGTDLQSDLMRRLESNHKALEAHIDDQARLASLGAATGRLAHDVRNLLASLRLSAERMAGMENEADRRAGQRMIASIDRALALCEWASRYKSAKRKNVDITQVPLSTLVDEVFSLVKLHDPRHRIELINAVDDNFVLMAERTLLFRILFNISLNGVQAMHKDGNKGFVAIHARKSDSEVFIDITDSGPGIDTKIAQSALTPYAGQHPEGTGLGIIIAADLSRWHGGSLELLRSDNLGTSFRVRLPSRQQGQDDVDPSLTTAGSDDLEALLRA
jgi:signal transduction histidine kinase